MMSRGAQYQDPRTVTLTSTLQTYWDDLAAKIEEFASTETPPEDWQEWLRALFPYSVTHPFGAHHKEFWEWVWSMPVSESRRVEKNNGVQGEEVDGGTASSSRPHPFIAIWPRGGGKTTSVELGIVAVGAKESRRYAVIVSESQDQADKKVGSIAAKLESRSVAKYYPSLGTRAVSKYGSSKGWRRNRLHTASGFVVDALGLDTAARGLKVEDYRPDWIILDDVDNRHDTEAATDKKIQILTDTILPIGTMDAAVTGVQNLIIPRGIFGRMVKGDVDFLVDRVISGPIPAVEDMEVEHVDGPGGKSRVVVTGGKATWRGQDLEACQKAIDTFGYSAFCRESQHEVEIEEGALWKREMFDWPGFRVAPGRIAGPGNEDGDIELDIVAVGVDPQGTKKQGSETGIVAVGVGRGDFEGHVFVLEDGSINGSPGEWGGRAVDVLDRNSGDWVVGERNYGGDMVEHTIMTVRNTVPFKMVVATRGKAQRMEPVVALYEKQVVHHVGTFGKLEKEMVTWHRGAGWSPNRVDALVWSIYAVVPELGGVMKSGVGHMWMRM